MVSLVSVAVKDRGHGCCCSILDLLADLLACGWCLLRHAVGLDAVGIVVKLAVCVHLVATVVTNESDEVLDGSRAAVFDGRSLVLGSEKLDGREALNLIWNIVGSGIDLCNGDLGGVRAEERSEFLVLGGKPV